jgi:geranylgeranyl pyrophosphate synthase
MAPPNQSPRPAASSSSSFVSPPDYANILTTLSTDWTPSEEETLLEPFTYLLANKGKEVRSQLIDAFNVWLDVKEEDLEVVRKVVGMLHTGSLLCVLRKSEKSW